MDFKHGWTRAELLVAAAVAALLASRWLGHDWRYHQWVEGVGNGTDTASATGKDSIGVAGTWAWYLLVAALVTVAGAAVLSAREQVYRSIPVVPPLPVRWATVPCALAGGLLVAAAARAELRWWDSTANDSKVIACGLFILLVGALLAVDSTTLAVAAGIAALAGGAAGIAFAGAPDDPPAPTVALEPFEHVATMRRGDGRWTDAARQGDEVHVLQYVASDRLLVADTPPRPIADDALTGLVDGWVALDGRDEVVLRSPDRELTITLEDAYARDSNIDGALTLVDDRLSFDEQEGRDAVRTSVAELVALRPDGGSIEFDDLPGEPVPFANRELQYPIPTRSHWRVDVIAEGPGGEPVGSLDPACGTADADRVYLGSIIRAEPDNDGGVWVLSEPAPDRQRLVHVDRDRQLATVPIPTNLAWIAVDEGQLFAMTDGERWGHLVRLDDPTAHLEVAEVGSPDCHAGIPERVAPEPTLTYPDAVNGLRDNEIALDAEGRTLTFDDGGRTQFTGPGGTRRLAFDLPRVVYVAADGDGGAWLLTSDIRELDEDGPSDDAALLEEARHHLVHVDADGKVGDPLIADGLVADSDTAAVHLGYPSEIVLVDGTGDTPPPMFTADGWFEATPDGLVEIAAGGAFASGSDVAFAGGVDGTTYRLADGQLFSMSDGSATPLIGSDDATARLTPVPVQLAKGTAPGDLALRNAQAARAADGSDDLIIETDGVFLRYQPGTGETTVVGQTTKELGISTELGIFTANEPSRDDDTAIITFTPDNQG